MDDPRPLESPSDGAASLAGRGIHRPAVETASAIVQGSPLAEIGVSSDYSGEQLSIADDLRILDDLDRVRLFGLNLVNAASLDPVVDEILGGPRRDDELQPVVLTPNVDIVVHLDQAHSHAPELELFRRAQFCLPDGQPLVMVSRFLGNQITARLPGSELFERLWPKIVARSLPVVVVASSDEIAGLLKRQHSGGSYIVPPMFDEDDEDAIADVVTDILTSARVTRPELVLVGIGHPKDARIIAALFKRWDTAESAKPLCLGLGGSFSMHLGLKKRAPTLIQKIGMEWFYRFLQEPRRLFHRYFVRDVAFFGIVRRARRAHRASR